LKYVFYFVPFVPYSDDSVGLDCQRLFFHLPFSLLRGPEEEQQIVCYDFANIPFVQERNGMKQTAFLFVQSEVKRFYSKLVDQASAPFVSPGFRHEDSAQVRSSALDMHPVSSRSLLPIKRQWEQRRRQGGTRGKKPQAKAKEE
jgi:hypothetical protein